MRKFVGLFAVLALLALIAAPASAVTLSYGEHSAKIRDHSNLYDPQTGAPRPIESPAVGLRLGDEQRTIFRTTTIFDGNNDVEFDTSRPSELTGVLYDLQILAVYNVGAAVVIDFGPAGRNPLTATGADVDGDSIGALDPTDGHAIVFGGVIEVYEDFSKDYNANPGGVAAYQTKLPAAAPVAMDAGAGPTFWVEGQGAGVRDSFPTVTDGNYWLAAQLVELQYLANVGAIADPASVGGIAFTAGTVLRETIEPSAGTGSGFGFANVFGGSYADLIERGHIAPLVDMSLLFNIDTPAFFNGVMNDTATYQGIGQWQVDSQDPIVFSTIPEPATMTLVGLGLVGLGVIRRRRK